MSKKADILFIIGVSGVGKSTIGKLLGETLRIPFYDGDDFHPESNIRKMSNGEALNDQDRFGWLNRLNELGKKHVEEKRSCIIACSALKENYRDILNENIEDAVRLIFLKGSFDKIRERLDEREDHFMSSKLLATQFDILEEPLNAIKIDIEQSPSQIVDEIKNQL